ncbi:conjugal transfer protein TraN [Paracoccus sp. 1_MG-2023]|uniref:conjugal transfer protein TraN n=1 Tax=unclassified Paracoccus (in: a-proteobacteria) TaxID=2688777 RepID=UPI001C092AF6|nr:MULTISPECIES: conjugal transfer protein TraN [unclassified Paracoccus (in: a-proteobacteria)]MBU2959144.1 conjugal transfer protein TraN [Paracoccus sp. C2R09]MDO6669427.1 conjugal transfer protein TraN [Paracoccus sp. 1_MG-2023]
MIRTIYVVSKAVCISATLHLSLLDLAWAQTSPEMREAASQAHTDTFKPNPSDLYSRSGQNITIRDAAPSGDMTFHSRAMNFGVTGQDASEGSLPHISTYEDLYSYRDTEIGQLEAGTGQFGSTGRVNAEANAMSVLRDSEGMPSVGTDFLFGSTEILEDGSEDTAEFGQCIIVEETGSVEYDYDSSVINTCDSSALALEPMSASRIYNGPHPLFTYRTISGVGYCEHEGNRVRTDTAQTCAKLSALETVPTNDRGDLSVRSCSGIERCVELVFDQDGSSTGAIMNFSMRDGIELSAARVTATSLRDSGYVAHNGSNIMSGDGSMNIAAITSSPSAAHQIGISGGTEEVLRRDPPSGYADIATTHYLHRYSSLWATRRYLTWDGETLDDPDRGDFPVSIGECVYHLGVWSHEDRYWRTDEDMIRANYYHLYRECSGTDNVDAHVVLRLNYSPTPLFTEWGYNATQYADLLSLASDAACRIEYTVEETAANSGGCVNSWTDSDGRTGVACGSSIPVAPFGMIDDRAATRIRINPICLEDPMGEAFTETNNCGLLEADSSCSFIGRTCALRLDDGTCAIHENRYQCGEAIRYTSPVVEELNICESSLSCMGDECIINTGTSGAEDLADTAAKLAAADMLMSDMQCTEDLDTAIDRDEAMLSCELFAGERETCSRRALGLSNCCTTPSGVSVADYLQLAFSVSRLSRAVEGTSLSSPLTSSWVSMENAARNSFSELSRPLTETWESIVGNSGAARNVGNALSMETVKQEMMKKAASWTAEVFGEQAANSIFQVGGGDAIAGGVLQPGNIGMTKVAATVMNAVMTAYTIYTLVNVLATVLLACSEGEQELMVRRALKSTHEIGEYCSRRVFGWCVSRRTAFCMFNSPLSRIMNEQAREQLGIDWGTPSDSNCQGITVRQFQSLDMDRIDLSEWTGMMMSSGMINFDRVTDIDTLTGTGSTYGRALEDLYTREDAITRNGNRYDGIDTDMLREDAAGDFGRGIVR